MSSTTQFQIALVVLGLAAGCHWAGTKSPVSQSLLSSRQFSHQGLAAMEQDRWDQAEELLAKAVAVCPVDAEARRHYAETLWRKGAAEEAIRQLTDAARVVPDDAELHVRLAEMLLEKKKLVEAHQHAERAIQLDPSLPRAWLARGRIVKQWNRPQQALADFHRALSHTPENREILLALAELHRQLYQPDRALATLQVLAATYPPGEEPQQTLYLIGLAYAALGRFDDASSSLAAAASRGTPTAEILFQLAEAQRLSGATEHAVVAAEHALRLDPTHWPSRELLEELRVAQAQGVLRR